MAATPGMTKQALRFKPEEVCLVPESREEITTEGGLDVAADVKRLKLVIAKLHPRKSRSAPSSTPTSRRSMPPIASARRPSNSTPAPMPTPPRARARRKELARHARAAAHAHEIGLRVNAGHGLHYTNVREYIEDVPHLHTLNIGHSIISRAIFVGLEQAVREMRELLGSREFAPNADCFHLRARLLSARLRHAAGNRWRRHVALIFGLDAGVEIVGFLLRIAGEQIDLLVKKLRHARRLWVRSGERGPAPAPHSKSPARVIIRRFADGTPARVDRLPGQIGGQHARRVGLRRLRQHRPAVDPRQAGPRHVFRQEREGVGKAGQRRGEFRRRDQKRRALLREKLPGGWPAFGNGAVTLSPGKFRE
jgi:hypothetical protein